MIKELLKYFRFLLGLFIAAGGTVLMIKADLGLSPWDVLHQGVSYIFDITIGQGNILISVVIFFTAVGLGAVAGSGSIIATFIFGIFVDLVLAMNIIPVSEGMLSGFIMLIVGTFIFAYGTYMSICEGLGCGPRDSFMLAVAKKTGKDPGRIRNFMEAGAFSGGFLMGGHAGIGTVVVALLTGFFLQRIFDFHNFDPSVREQRDLRGEGSILLRWLREKGGSKIKTS